ncbi:MAG: nitrous oxide-stimulated promoter family protein [archaeon]|nr:nitrous oxide-stimulated promoter family protein [archaeon]
MISIYCEAHHTQEKSKSLCNECQIILNYAIMKIAKCPQIENKPTCQKCKIHCYGKKERETIRKIMRYSGPRMIFKHPILAILHIIDGVRSRDM